MKRYLLISGLIISAFLLMACSILPRIEPGAQVTETRDVSNFHAVRFEAAGDLVISQGDKESLVIKAGKNIMPHLTSEVINGVLIIGVDEPRWNVGIPEPVKYSLFVNNLDDIVIAGAGNVKMDDLRTTAMKIDVSGAGNFDIGNLEADSLTLSLSGAGNIEVTDLQASELDATLSGAGNFSMAGKVADQTALLIGLGAYQTGDLESERVKVEVAGAGGATVWATEQLDVIISGAGSVEYYGSPKVTQDVNGLGSVRSLGDK